MMIGKPVCMTMRSLISHYSNYFIYIDPDYENKVTEEEQRWGQNGIAHRSEAIDMKKLIEETGKNDESKKKQLIMETGITGSRGLSLIL